ncbi:MAG: hypothetical protein IPM69_06455 [Ignavibacteria bacterium]|nr:hypothetical protein [Ignavibacteria bacterium]
MSVRTFWTIFIKILGIWLVFSSLTVIPQVITTSLASFFPEESNGYLLVLIPILLLTIGVYVYILTVFVFKTSWLIDKLELDKGFAEDTININIPRYTLLSISVIVIGGVIFIDSLPLFLNEFFVTIRIFNVKHEAPDGEWVVYYFVKTILGYILMHKNKEIVRLIDKDAPPTAVESDEEVSVDSDEDIDKSDT